MRLPIEPDSFRQRLLQGLRKIGFPPDSPTALAREFNRRHSGTPVTVHAARRWLLGQAVPTQGKLRSIALWLEVSPEWLRFGHSSPMPQARPARGRGAPLDPADLALLADIGLLCDADQRLARDFVHALFKLQTKRPRTAGTRRPPCPM
ncbi:MAG: hypothetical protein ABIT83_18405 [Massilia sp.]